jgi:hypothetical protein
MRLAGHPGRKLHVECDNYATHKHPNIVAWLAKESAGDPAIHPDQRVLVEHGRDLLRDHHQPGQPPWQLWALEVYDPAVLASRRDGVRCRPALIEGRSIQI